MEDHFRFWSDKKPNKPSVYKAGNIFITLLNQEEATVMKKIA